MSRLTFAKEGLYFYQIIFNDGRTVRRQGVTKKLAEAISQSMIAEAYLLDVREVSYGKL